MYLDPSQIKQTDRYKIVTGVVLPRPIAWVSSRNEAGVLNAAPYSFFTVASTNPLTMIFCPQQPAAGVEKDSLRNVEAVGEFVINIVDETTAEAMNLTAASLPAGQSEFEYAGLTPVDSRTISVPRIGEAPVAFECVLESIVRQGENGPGGGAVVFGRVTAIFMREGIYRDSYIDLDALQPIGRLMGRKYSRVNDIFEMTRP